MVAVRLAGARGDLTGTEHHLWTRTRGTPYVPSILLYDDALYFLSHYQNVMSRADLGTGENDGGPFRLRGLGNVYASPVGAAGRIYVTDLEGRTLVLRHGKEAQPLALNDLGEPVSASAAIAGHEIFLRGDVHLYCIADSAERASGR